jgi:hypothetical protein
LNINEVPDLLQAVVCPMIESPAMKLLRKLILCNKLMNFVIHQIGSYLVFLCQSGVFSLAMAELSSSDDMCGRKNPEGV